MVMDSSVMLGVSKITEGVEIGDAIEKKHQGSGYAQEAVSQMLHLLEVNTNVTAIYGIVDPENEASKNVLERSGFLKEGRRLDKIVYKRLLIH
ncbi:MAG TPA: GNAT family N-acetyltransferase [Thermoanaerobaculia bacterium]|nr:GNAT family N-acetyltransferase [Thermoanaerobaculia bacterium]